MRDQSVPALIGVDRRAARRQRAGVLLCVAALHLLLIAMLGDPITPRTQREASMRITLRLIAPTLAPAPPPPRAEPITPAAQATARIGPRGQGARAERAPRPLPVPNTDAPDPELPTGAVAGSAEPAVTADTAASRPQSLMDTEATRRAIRASARAPSLTDELARAADMPRPASTQERMGSAVRSAGKGDCAKGEYAGAGMGVLSLPFLAVAVASGDCAQ